MTKKHFIFDLDGTLWDATTVIAGAWDYILKNDGRCQKTITAGILKQEFGKTMAVIGDNLFPEFDPGTRTALVDKCCRYQEETLEQIEADLTYPMVRETLAKLSKLADIYIVSNCQAGYIELFLRKYGMAHLVTDTECYGNTGQGKAANITRLMKRNQITDAYYIGDTMGDCDAAAQARVPFIFASYGYGHADRYEAKITDITQILAFAGPSALPVKIDVGRFLAPCSCGQIHNIGVKEIYIEPNATRYLPRILKQYQTPVFICDQNTYQAAEPALAPFFDLYQVIVLEPAGVAADNRHVEIICKALPAQPDLLIAAGSGTIHDLTRYVSSQAGIPFVSYPTAASVDGFLSTGAAMTWHGLKKTFPAGSPLYVIADTDVFSQAPRRLTASGFADLMGKYTALADWKIAHLVSGEFFCQEICDLVQDAADTAGGAVTQISRGDKSSIQQLMYALLLSGLAMQMLGNSRPASGAEHHLSHLWEMHVINPPLDALHGEKVSVGLLMCLEQYSHIKELLKQDNYRLSGSTDFEYGLLEKYLAPSGLYQMVVDENGDNLLTDEIVGNLDRCRNKIEAILDALPGREEMEQKLARAGCPLHLSDIGLPDDISSLSLALSPYIKRRLTLMRLSKAILPAAGPLSQTGRR